jgi:glycosyltransferase involved in cell wall biosynthesis
MKILFISENYPPHIEGGAEISTSLLANWLVQQGHNVFVACCRFAKHSWVENGVVIYPIISKASLGSKNFFSAIQYAFGIIIAPIVSGIRVVRLIRKVKPDVINIVVTIYYFIPIIFIIRMFSKKPIVIDARDYSLICPVQFKGNEIDDPKHSTHGYRCLKDVYEPSNKFLLMFARIFARYEAFIFNLYKSKLISLVNSSDNITVIANSQYVQKQLILNGFKEARTMYIYNISQVVNNTDQVVKPIIPIFVYGGRIEKEKGIWDLIHAAELVKKEANNSFSIKIAGSGSEFNAVKNYIENNQLSYIELLGHVSSETLLGLYKQSLALVAPSRWPEPFGRFIQESASIGKPVIATRAGGIVEGIEDSVTGILFSIGDIKQLADAMNYFIQHPEQSSIMGLAAKKMLYKYDADTIGNKRLAVYQL